MKLQATTYNYKKHILFLEQTKYIEYTRGKGWCTCRHVLYIYIREIPKKDVDRQRRVLHLLVWWSQVSLGHRMLCTILFSMQHKRQYVTKRMKFVLKLMLGF